MIGREEYNIDHNVLSVWRLYYLNEKTDTHTEKQHSIFIADETKICQLKTNKQLLLKNYFIYDYVLN